MVLDEWIAVTRHTKRVASNRAFHEEDWTMERDASWEEAKGKVERMIRELVYIFKALLH